MCLAGVAAILVVFMNRNYETRFWPGATDRDLPVLWLMLGSGVSSVIAFWLITRIRRVMKDVAELAREKRKAEETAAQARRAAELEKQEKRIDEKLTKALEDQKSQG
ncbi:MAG: hypothetical protein AMXMBFR20_24910 [Planctomycetia bacterium]